jgi:asparaginyl-tRNA synthetase
MKQVYIQKLLENDSLNSQVELLSWVKSKRCYANVVFFDLIDSTGIIQAVARKASLGTEAFEAITKITPESSIKAVGTVVLSAKEGKNEVALTEMCVIAPADLQLSPRPRMVRDVFNEKYCDLVLRKRHFFIRNPKMMAVLKVRQKVMWLLRNWFDEQSFVEIDPPMLTQVTLYDDVSTFSLNYFGSKAFLTQCSAFYLEAASHAFEKVYSIAPAFRAELGHTRRHNPEFWQVKADVAFYDLDDIISFAEQMIYMVAKGVSEKCPRELEELGVSLDLDKLIPPYPKISYDDAVERLKTKNKVLEWGKSLGADEERLLSGDFQSPFFVTDMPRSIEPFPYAVNTKNPRVTLAADLIAPEGYGELLGVAEKVWDYDTLLKQFTEDGKLPNKDNYEWYLELRRYGSVPHSGFGMGIERLLRWLLKLPRVTDTLAFPRVYRREPYP